MPLLVSWKKLFLMMGLFSQAMAEVVNYYIAAQEVIWDYAPLGVNLVTSDQESYKTFLEHGPQRIGHKYRKAIYKQYTNSSFTQEIPKNQSLGFLGPMIAGSVGQTLHIHFFNNATRNFSMHPHGLFYTKANEGALYMDDTSTKDKADDNVLPGTTFVYEWQILEFNAPTSADSDCIPWAYHSHIDPVKDINSGLIGMLVTCKKGKRYDDEHSHTLLLKVLDENLSWYIEENVKEFTTKAVDLEDEDFQESNKMHSINGKMYGALNGLEVCENDNITWYLMGMGNEVDIHTLNFHGQSFQYNHHRMDSVNLYPAQFAVATMQVKGIGRWLVSCHVHDHFVGGMMALLQITHCRKSGSGGTGTKVIEYFIAAEEIEWDYSLDGKNLYDGGSLTKAGSDSEVFFKNGPHRIGGKYIKAIYREYTNRNFNKLKKRSSEEAHLGFLGPVIRASVGDLIKVVFYNKASRVYSIHPYGVHYSKYNEGSSYSDHFAPGLYQLNANPGHQKTYYWHVTDDMAPLPSDPPCLTRMYASRIDPMKDSYSGLVGPMIICKRGALSTLGKQKGIDREFFLLFSVTDENNSWYIKKNVKKYTSDPDNVDYDDEDFQESNLMHGINGYLYGNLPGLDMCLGNRISWHIMAIGNEVDLHTVYFHGNTFTVHQNHKDTINVIPGMFQTLTMNVTNPGKWAVVCRTNDHFNAGTKALYEVKKCNQKTSLPREESGETVEYFIQAVETEWDYAPNHTDHIHGTSLDDPEHPGNAFVKHSDSLIGSKYIKAVYRAYTDKTFSTALAHKDSLGILGPVIRANVGDTIKVVFKNSARFPFSIQAHGVRYNKTFEGSVYEDSVIKVKKEGSIIQPNGTFTYIWTVPKSSGPGPKDPDCINYAYYSGVNPSKDTNSGLIGPLVICRRGISKPPPFKEFPLMLTILDENESMYLDANIIKYSPNGNKEDEDFIENNKNHAINGYLYGALTGLVMNQNDVVYWYLMGMGTEADIHSTHFHGNNFIHYTDYQYLKDTLDLWPGIFSTVVMRVKNAGFWLLHCHVDDHIIGGMETRYRVNSVKLS